MLFPDHTHLLIATVYPAMTLCNVLFQCLTNCLCSWQVVLCSCQLQAVGATNYIVTVFLKENVTCALERDKNGDNHTQSYHLGRYIVRYAFRGHVSGSANVSPKN